MSGQAWEKGAASAAEGDADWLARRLQAGDRVVLGELLSSLYEDLRGLARRKLRGSGSITLQPTALVNEACLRLLAARQLTVRSRAHLLALAATAMRQVLVDHARRRGAARRGGDATRLSLEGLDPAAPVEAESEASDLDVIALSEALDRLESLHARKARVVELRFFGGLSLEEAATALDVSRATVASDWHFARAWIVNEMREQGAA